MIRRRWSDCVVLAFASVTLCNFAGAQDPRSRVSVDDIGIEGDGQSTQPRFSQDGRFVAFISLATNLVPGDTNGSFDVFIHDRDPDGNGVFDEGNGVTTRVSVRSNGKQGN